MHTKKVACRRIWNEQGGLLKEIGGFAEDMGYILFWDVHILGEVLSIFW